MCRDCGEEYRPEVVRCADCGGELEDRTTRASPPRAAEPQDEAPEAELAGYRALFVTPRAADLVPMAERLRGRAIEYRLAEQPGARRGAAALRDRGAERTPQRALAALADLVAPHEDAADVHAVETRFDPERGYVQCPACGADAAARGGRVPRVRPGAGRRRRGGRRAARVSVRPGTSGALSRPREALALETGFDLAGFARADAPPELAFFAEWVARGHAGEMAYLTSQVAKRSDLRAAFPWARSVLCVGLQYDTPHPYSTDAPPRTAAGSRATPGATTTTT